MSQILSSKRYVFGFTVIALLLSTAFATVNLYNEENDNPEDDLGPALSDPIVEIIPFQGNLSTEFEIDKTSFYKGENLNFSVALDVTDNPVVLHEIKIQVKDLQNSRIANQSIEIEEVYLVGQSKINLTLTPGFDIDGFVVLRNGNFNLTNYFIIFSQLQIKFQQKSELNIPLVGDLKEEYNQLAKKSWNINKTVNVTVSTSFSTFNVTSTEPNGSVTFIAELKTKGYTRIYYNVSFFNFSSVSINLNATTKLSSNNTGKYVEIGQYYRITNVSITFDLRGKENITLSLWMPTREIPILTLIANNNWEGVSEDGAPFRNPVYYLDQVNIQFRLIFNLTFIPVTIVPFKSNKFSSSLFVMRDEASLTVGRNLELPGSRWRQAVGTHSDNAGADIMVIFTNKTMDHLGVVFSGQDGNLNMAINARGSLNTGNTGIELRVSSLWADNLVQHELSHIYGAPDRWTEDSSPSIMTKSRPADALFDIWLGNYWLLRVDWLEEDIQGMVDVIARDH